MKETPGGYAYLSRNESPSLTCMLAAPERYEIMSMSTAELETFLGQTFPTPLGVIATLRSDGSPHIEAYSKFSLKKYSPTAAR
jgi:hypothetical protein